MDDFTIKKETRNLLMAVNNLLNGRTVVEISTGLRGTKRIAVVKKS